jgi:hypothetical protein
VAWGTEEIELARKVLDQDWGLRGPLAAIYGDLTSRPNGAAGAELERMLSGFGRHPRSPATTGRCLRVLAELGLVALEPSSATVKCTIMTEGRLADGHRRSAELERSEAFRAYRELYRQGLRFLEDQAQAMTRTKAA